MSLPSSPTSPEADLQFDLEWILGRQDPDQLFRIEASPVATNMLPPTRSPHAPAPPTAPRSRSRTRSPSQTSIPSPSNRLPWSCQVRVPAGGCSRSDAPWLCEVLPPSAAASEGTQPLPLDLPGSGSQVVAEAAEADEECDREASDQPEEEEAEGATP